MRRCLVCALLLCWSSAASAVDPLTLMLLRMMRDHTISATLETGVNSLRRPSDPPIAGWPVEPAPVQGTDEAGLKSLIDESFLYLTSAQRDAVHAGLMKVITEPQNATIKQQIIAEFRIKAKAVRDLYVILDRLSWAEKKTLAAQAREQYMKLPGNQRRELLDVLRAGILPVPRDLNDIMLAEFTSVQPMVSDARRSE